jgi:hypothetical protein
MASGVWRVRLRFVHRNKRHSADWELRKDTGEVRPRNALAIDLGWRPPPADRSRSTESKREHAANGNGDEGNGERAPARRRAPAKRRAAPKRRAGAKRTTRKPKRAASARTSRARRR